MQRQTGYHPVNVEVMLDRDAIIELEPEIRVGEVAQLLHGTHGWDGQLAEISACCPPAEALSVLYKKGKMAVPGYSSWRMSRGE